AQAVEGAGFHRYMPHRNVLIWAVVSLHGVPPDQEARTGFEIHLTVCLDMAAFTVLVNRSMAHLAGEFAAVHFVHQNVVIPGSHGDMAGFTARRLYAIVAVIGRRQLLAFRARMAGLAFCGLPVHFTSLMAVHAFHTTLGVVHVPAVPILTEKLRASQGVMTCSTGGLHVRPALEHMPGNQPAAGGLRIADMTVAAGSLVIAKNRIHSLVHSRMIGQQTALLQRVADPA